MKLLLKMSVMSTCVVLGQVDFVNLIRASVLVYIQVF